MIAHENLNNSLGIKLNTKNSSASYYDEDENICLAPDDCLLRL